MEGQEPKAEMDAAEQQKPEGLLYHYTNQSGLLGILKDKCIWATHIRYLNDLEEYGVGVRLVRKVIEETRAQGLIDEGIENSFKRILDTLDSCDFYAASFSQANDGDSLNLWRAYASSLPGYSLGFPPEKLRDVIRPRSDGNHAGMSWLSEIFYISGEESVEPNFKSSYRTIPTISSLIAHLKLNSYTSIILPGMNMEDRVAAVRKMLESVQKVGILLMSILPALKDAAFSAEMESRIISVRSPDAPSNETNPVKFHCGTWSIAPHVEIPLCLGNDQPPIIEKIVVGPCPHPSEAVKAVQLLLSSKGITGVEVVPSKIPYRNW